jgi:hypothetical protein
MQMRHDDPFFSKTSQMFADFTPEAPADMFGAIRRRYAFLAFFTWNAARLNVYYVAMAAAASVWALMPGETPMGNMAIDSTLSNNRLEMNMAARPANEIQAEEMAVATLESAAVAPTFPKSKVANTQSSNQTADISENETAVSTASDGSDAEVTKKERKTIPVFLRKEVKTGKE